MKIKGLFPASLFKETWLLFLFGSFFYHRTPEPLEEKVRESLTNSPQQFPFLDRLSKIVGSSTRKPLGWSIAKSKKKRTPKEIRQDYQTKGYKCERPSDETLLEWIEDVVSYPDHRIPWPPLLIRNRTPSRSLAFWMRNALVAGTDCSRSVEWAEVNGFTHIHELVLLCHRSV